MLGYILSYKCGCFASLDRDGSTRSISLCLKHLRGITVKTESEIIEWLKNNVEEHEKIKKGGSL